jgi:hypothetical protein
VCQPHQEHASQGLLTSHVNDRGAHHPACDYVVRGSRYHQEPDSNKTIRTSIPQNKRNRDVCPRNGPELSAHSPQSGGQPAHLSIPPCTGWRRSPRRQNPKGHGFFFFPNMSWDSRLSRINRLLQISSVVVDMYVCLYIMCVCVRVYI